MARVSTLTKRFAAVTAALQQDSSGRFVDLALQFREVARVNGELVATGRMSRVYGGVWDRLAIGADGMVGAWSTHREVRPLALDASPAQFAVLCDDTTKHLLLVGSRRSSKTETLARWVLKQCCRFPRRPISVLVQKRSKARTLVADKLLPLLPHGWLAQKRAPVTMSQDQTSVDLAHGGRIRFLTGKVADDARGDGIPALAVDERQIIDREAVENAMLSVSEGGDAFQTIETGTALDGEFREYCDQAKTNSDYRLTELSITDNVFLETVHDPETGCDLPPFVLSARKVMDPDRFAQEVGDWDSERKRFVPRFVQASALVHWPFDRQVHVHSVADAERVIKAMYGVGCADATKQTTGRTHRAAHARIVGIDFRVQPMCAVVIRVFSLGRDKPDVAWVVEEIVLDDAADATRLAQRLVERGHGDCAAVIDAAGKFSDGGRSSLRMLREQKVDVRAPTKNPHPQDAINAINAKLLNASNHVGLLVDPKCTRLIDALSSHRYAESSYKPARDDHVNLLRSLSWPIAFYWPAAQVMTHGN